MDNHLTIKSLLLYLQTHRSHAYAILFFGSYLETLIGPGFFLYGEIFFLPGAILAGAGFLNIWLVALVTIGGGIIGDNTSYLLGRKFGKKLFTEDGFVLNHNNYEKGQAYFQKYGIKGIFLARFMGPLSWITPFLSGTYKIPYRQFMTYNAPGVVAGIGQFLIVGYFFGNNYETMLKLLGNYSAYFLLAIISLVLIVWAVRRNYQK